MKIDILTIHFGVNYGSALQSYALSKVLEDLENEVEIINYIPKRYNYWVIAKKNKYNFGLIIAYYIIKFPFIYYQRKVFNRFLKENLKMTKCYHTPNEIKENIPFADVYFVGSDQIWNFDYNDYNDMSYFLDFLNKDKVKISYAASIGKEKITTLENKVLKKYLKEFNYISVREDSAKNILGKINIKAEHVLDPTMLLTREEWSTKFKGKLPYKNYLLVYVMDNQYKNLIDFAEKVAIEKKLKIVVITFRKTKDKRVDKEYILKSPFEFINLLDKSKFIVTNSFHGVAFSINFSKQFVAIGKEKYNTRIKSLLNVFDLKSRYISKKKNNTVNFNENINYEKVNKIMKINRKISKDFILNSIGKKYD